MLAIEDCSSGNQDDYSDVKLAHLEMSTNAGFAIGSPGAPRVVYASDQIRTAWILA
jgi:hypothetical protein